MLLLLFKTALLHWACLFFFACAFHLNIIYYHRMYVVCTCMYVCMNVCKYVSM